jgi:HlyD family secretion protein
LWKWLLGLALTLLALLLGGGYWAYSSGALDEIRRVFDPSLAPTYVRLGVAEKGQLTRTVSAPGQIEPKTKVEISAQVSARIIELPFRENQDVREGDVVLRLDGRDLQAALVSAQANHKSQLAQLDRAKAEFARLSAELGRARELFASNDIPRAQLEQAEMEFARGEANLRSAQFAVAIAEANIQRAEKDLSNTIVTAPFDGVITRLNAEVGELVVVGTLNNPASVIMEIADLSVMILKARVDEANVARVREGQRARVFVNAFPDLPIEGRVDRVGLKREMDRDGTAYFETEILLDKPDHMLLRSGMTANADIEVETFESVVKVPSQAVQDRNIDDLPRDLIERAPFVDRNKRFVRVVFVFEDGKVVARPVDVGASDLTHTVIRAGLEENTPIVVGPFKVLTSLKHDQRAQDEAGKPPEKKSERAAGGPLIRARRT